MTDYYLSININNCDFDTFISPIYTFSLAGNSCLHVKSRYKDGKVFSQQTTTKVKMPNLVGNKHLSIHFLLHSTRPFHLPTEKEQT